MKKIMTAAALAVGLATASSAFAIGAIPGFELALQAGYAFQDRAEGIQTISGTSIDMSKYEFSFGGEAGYNFELAPNWLVGGTIGLEWLGYRRGTVQDGADVNLTFKNRFYSVNFMGNITYEYQGMYVFTEAGLGIGLNDITSSLNTPIGDYSDEGTHSTAVFILGGGLGYQWDQIDFFARYDHYFGDDKNDINNYKFPTINAVYGGVGYTFM